MTSPSVRRPPADGAGSSRADDPTDADGAGERQGGAAGALARISPQSAVPAPERARGPLPAHRSSGGRTAPRARGCDAAGLRPAGLPASSGLAGTTGLAGSFGLSGGPVRSGVCGLPVDLAEVTAAAGWLGGVARRTRVVPAAGSLTGHVGAPVWLKCEHEQHTGSFKLRGAFNRIATAGPRARARGVVAASAGNHAQGVAFAAAHFGVAATIFVPEGANPAKVARTRALGARVEHVPGGVDAALRAADAFAAASGGLLVHPFDDVAVIAGQATIGLELLEQVPELSTVIVGVGGGGLLSGLAVALRGLRPDVRVIGVQAAAAPAFASSFHTGRRLVVPPGAPGTGTGSGTDACQAGAATGTVADGMAVGAPGRLTLALAERLVDDVVTVDEDAFWEAMVALRRSGHRVEPAGAAGVAALLRMPRLAHGATAVVLSGGNLDPAVDARVAALAAGASAGARTNAPG
ncbi:threonine/serine dehydratase [Parafrankia sp. EUN1f]|uniref:threonine ammonia-lyase n=1 Tax=Parafrankia sp. EUN1f TaxID=102897 RepID=UPI0001C4672D|nr:pyridoxal-phosphate dependent enzyme [Parafrankia sp. EUN1f]EFC83169.1 Pyridoxal-5'-phosphate-dependent protein beta subunit [Parafrankia sp. EUN1f]